MGEEKFNLDIQSETDLLMVQRDYLLELANFDLVEVDTVEFLIAIEQRITAEPRNVFLPRLRAFIRNRSNL
jgi:hypothetical protein